jgi:hypothetical protein
MDGIRQAGSGVQQHVGPKGLMQQHSPVTRRLCDGAKHLTRGGTLPERSPSQPAS